MALPLLRLAGEQRPGDAAWQEILCPVANRLITRCDAVLRLAGESKGADEDVRLATERGLPVYYRLEDCRAVVPQWQEYHETSHTSSERLCKRYPGNPLSHAHSAQS